MYCAKYILCSIEVVFAINIKHESEDQERQHLKSSMRKICLWSLCLFMSYLFENEILYNAINVEISTELYLLKTLLWKKLYHHCL